MPSVYDNKYTIGDLTFSIHKNSPYIIDLSGPLTFKTTPLLTKKLLGLNVKSLVLDFNNVPSIDQQSIDMILKVSKLIEITIWNPNHTIRAAFTCLNCLPELNPAL